MKRFLGTALLQNTIIHNPYGPVDLFPTLLYFPDNGRNNMNVKCLFINVTILFYHLEIVFVKYVLGYLHPLRKSAPCSFQCWILQI